MTTRWGLPVLIALSRLIGRTTNTYEREQTSLSTTTYILLTASYSQCNTCCGLRAPTVLSRLIHLLIEEKMTGLVFHLTHFHFQSYHTAHIFTLDHSQLASILRYSHNVPGRENNKRRAHVHHLPTRANMSLASLFGGLFRPPCRGGTLVPTNTACDGQSG